MKGKLTFKVVIAVMAILMLPIKRFQTCCGFYFGRQLTADSSSHVLAITEDYPYYPNGGNNKTCCCGRKNYKEGDQIVDESNGFLSTRNQRNEVYLTYDSAHWRW